MEKFVQFDTALRKLICSGNWNLENIEKIESSLNKIHVPQLNSLVIDGKAIDNMDSAGAWLLTQWINQKHIETHLENFSHDHQTLLHLIETQHVEKINLPVRQKPGWINRLGMISTEYLYEFQDYLNFVGKLTFESLRLIRHPRLFRAPSLVSVIDKTGYQALPIIALLSFMIGVVLAYQMGVQLRNYGANVFIVNLLGLSVLREFGPMLTAIMVAGRTGSSFTAQLGIMKINQEIDALDTLGVTPGELLLLPRILGLVIVLPLLTIWADIFGIIGGMVMANNMLNISFYDFLHRFQQEIPLRSLIIGLGKAPVFALLVASIGCFEGMEVKSTADSLGRNTTRSVVFSIFSIIVVDAVFSIIFSKLKL